MELCAEVVKGVRDVLAGRVEELFAVVTCLLVVELGVDVFFDVKGVDDVLAGLGVELGAVFSLVEELFAVVKCVSDVLA